MTARVTTALRFCLTCRKESPRAGFIGPKCGPCVIKFGVPRK